MSFLRVGDQFAYDPRTLHPLEYEWADERSVDEVAGFSVRLASQSGAHELEETDLRVTRAMALHLAGSRPRMDRLMGCLVDAGVWSQDGTGWRLENDTAYLHLLTADEIERQRARGKDERDVNLTTLAKLRDGDNCRYCGSEVKWADRKSLRGATWEHVNIEQQPTPLELFVVCCFGCNRNPNDRAQLRPPPERPRYSDATKAFIKKSLNKVPTPTEALVLYPGLRTWPLENATGSQRPDVKSDTATASQRTKSPAHAATNGPLRPERASGNAGATDGEKGAVPGAQAVSVQDHLIRTDTGSHGSGFAGSGRDVTGQVLSGSDGSGLDAAAGTPSAPSKRSRRGGRAKGDSHER